MFGFLIAVGIFAALIQIAYDKCKAASRQNHLEKVAHDFVENAIASNTLYPFESSYRASGYVKGSCERFQDMNFLEPKEARILIFAETERRGVPYLEKDLPTGGLAQFAETLNP